MRKSNKDFIDLIDPRTRLNSKYIILLLISDLFNTVIDFSMNRNYRQYYQYERRITFASFYDDIS